MAERWIRLPYERERQDCPFDRCRSNPGPLGSVDGAHFRFGIDGAYHSGDQLWHGLGIFGSGPMIDEQFTQGIAMRKNVQLNFKSLTTFWTHRRC